MAGGNAKAGLGLLLAMALACGTAEREGAPGAAPDDSVTPASPATHARCLPTAGEPRWLEEGQSVSATVRCSTGLTEPSLRFAVAPLPPGASFDEASGTLTWTTARGQAAVWNLEVLEKTTGEKGNLKVGVAVAIERGRKVTIQDPTRYTEEYGLPVFHLSFTELTAGGYRPAQLVYRGRTFTLEAKYRGATSSVFPKRSFTLKFPETSLFDEPVFGGDFKGLKKLVLVTTFNDNSYMRTRLAFDLWNRMSPDHIRVRTYSAVVYANGRYLGL